MAGEFVLGGVAYVTGPTRAICGVYPAALAARSLAALVLLCAFLGLAPRDAALAADIEGPAVETTTARELPPPAIALLRTDTPRQTVTTFLALRDEMVAALAAYRADRSRANFAHVVESARRLRSLIDVSAVAPASRAQVAMETAFALLDVFDHVAPPAALPDEGDETYVFPGTPFRITAIENGPRRGEFLFSGDTVPAAPRMARGLAGAPRRIERPFDSWTTKLRTLSGPAIPLGFVALFPSDGYGLWLDNPAWKHVALILLITATSGLIAAGSAATRRLRRGRSLGSVAARLSTPILIIVAAALLERFVEVQLNIGGRLDEYFRALLALRHLAWAWVFWIVAVLIAETLIARPSVKEASLDANLLRLSARILGLVGAVLIVANGVQSLGLPAFSILAGLGIGGLGLALAIRPSLENLIAGYILYLDRPLRVGDFCQFGDRSGVVEHIGMRSTRIRGLDRTLISVPNAHLADMEIVNWAQCDRMMIERTIRLRYETHPDQLRWVLARLRGMFHAHPRIDSDTVRVRFAGHGESSLDIEIRVYALTREWNDFFAIREDVLLRVTDIVARSGTGFAFPSRTVYAATDEGLDATRSERARRQVERWRETGVLPFPRLPEEILERLKGRLDYPPRGSPGYTAGDTTGDELWPESAEPLSTDDMGAEDRSEPHSEARDEDRKSRDGG